MKKILLVYYSRSGNTAQVASELAQACSCDVEAIKSVKARFGPLGLLRCALDGWIERRPAIGPLNNDPLLYDLAIVGTPVWVAHVSGPVRTFLAKNRSKLNRVAFFCTSGGKDAEPVLAEMARLCGKTPVASVGFSEAEIKSNRHREKLEEFAHALVRAVDPPQSPPRRQIANTLQ